MNVRLIMFITLISTVSAPMFSAQIDSYIVAKQVINKSLGIQSTHRNSPSMASVLGAYGALRAMAGAIHKNLHTYFKPLYPPKYMVDILERDDTYFMRIRWRRIRQAIVGDQSLYIKKMAFDRIKNALCVQTIIDQQGIADVIIPKKYAYCLHGSWVVVCEDVTPAGRPRIINSVFDTKFAQTFVQLVQETGYHDWHNGNIMTVTDAGGNLKVAFIDHEDQSFASCNSSLQTYVKRFPEMFTPEARKLIDKADLTPKRCIQDVSLADSGIDFDAIEQWLAYQKRMDRCLKKLPLPQNRMDCCLKKLPLPVVAAASQPLLFSQKERLLMLKELLDLL